MFSSAIRNCVPAVVILVLLFLCACSIKEDRESCPCYLSLAVDSGTFFHDEVCWFLDADAYAENGEIEYVGVNTHCIVAVPRGEVNLCAVSGAAGCLASDGAVNIGQGAQCPPVYLYGTVLDTRRESLTDTIRLHKNYSTIKLAGGNSGMLAYEISGNVCGYDRRGSPLQGQFNAFCDVADEIYSCRVPRQLDNSLRLNLYKEDILMRSFPLGEYIERSGYDWGAEDLEDIDVSLDLSASEATVEVNGWVHRLTFYIDF